ncbi:MAG: hypothetical protein ACKPKO_06440, partial [Candidatus Fonsibacter sp.]
MKAFGLHSPQKGIGTDGIEDSPRPGSETRGCENSSVCPKAQHENSPDCAKTLQIKAHDPIDSLIEEIALLRALDSLVVPAWPCAPGGFYVETGADSTVDALAAEQKVEVNSSHSPQKEVAETPPPKNKAIKAGETVDPGVLRAAVDVTLQVTGADLTVDALAAEQKVEESSSHSPQKEVA